MSNKINRGTAAPISTRTNEKYIAIDDTKVVKKFRVTIPSKATHIGYFLTLEEAVQARDKYLDTH